MERRHATNAQPEVKRLDCAAEGLTRYKRIADSGLHAEVPLADDSMERHTIGGTTVSIDQRLVISQLKL